jgi:predicted methyltransferase MtxX (methanogen marker protein 4)
VTGRRGKRHKQLLDDLKEKRMLGIERGSSRSYCIELALEEAMDLLERQATE